MNYIVEILNLFEFRCKHGSYTVYKQLLYGKFTT